MVRQARVLAQATSDLVNAMRSDAEAEIDMENSKKLLAAAKLLADSTARMVEAAKVPRACGQLLWEWFPDIWAPCEKIQMTQAHIARFTGEMCISLE